MNCIIHEFVQNKQRTDDVGHTSQILMVADENNVILDTPQKQKQCFSLKLLTLVIKT
jgi:hypothetical protein